MESLGAMYDLRLTGKETLNGEDVYVIESSMNPDTRRNYEKNPEMQWMFDVEQKIYLGADDGVMRKMVSEGVTTMSLRNIDFDAKITKKDLILAIPKGEEVMDLTEQMIEQFSSMVTD
jgi:hypothetical protein